jgi:hypothetical protein
MTKLSSTPENANAQSIDAAKEQNGSDGNDILLSSTDISSPADNGEGGTLMLTKSDLSTNIDHDTTTGFQSESGQNVLDVRDLISGHIASDNIGGYLQFTANNGVVTLSIDLHNPEGGGNSTHVPLGTIEGVSGLNGSQILNTLLANHEIKFD